MQDKKQITVQVSGKITLTDSVDPAGSSRIVIDLSGLQVSLSHPVALEEQEADAYDPRYRVPKDVPPPREHSTNWRVWVEAVSLQQPFTRQEFESIVPRAMKYDSLTRMFGIDTNFRNIRRAQQAYFSEFRKRRWIVREGEE